MLIQIIIITNNMIPKAILPDSTMSKLLPKLSYISDLESVSDIRDCLAAIVDDYVEVVRKNNTCLRFFGLPALPENICVQQEQRLTLECNNCHKVVSMLSVISPQCFHCDGISYYRVSGSREPDLLLAGYPQKLHLEIQGCVRRNKATGASGAIAEFGRNNQFPFAADFHTQDAFIPALNDPTGAKWE